MKRIKILIAFFTFTTVIFSLASCNYDDSGIRNRIDNIDERLTTLEEVVKEMNNDISSLMTVVQALKNQVSITSVKAFEDGSGYYIDFSDGKQITVTNGVNGLDGTDGSTPVISVKVDSDGEYYWTVNGEWLLDENNSKIPATSKTQIPQIRVENGNFELSFNGVDWQFIGSAGSAGIFKDVIPGEDSVTFILNDGEPIIIPLVQEFALNIEKVEFPVTAGGFVNVPYTISACDEGTAIMAFATGGFTAEVGYNFDNDISSGNVGITCPDPLIDGKVVVIATNSKGITSARILSFEQGIFDAYEF
ncbi:MAG: PL29 family lyase N-terminal domain-containing protein, partial [Candidatus Cryptobacteroides sp.]